MSFLHAGIKVHATPSQPLLSQCGSESGSEESEAVGSSQMVPWLGEGRAIKTEVMSLQPAGR